MPPETAREVAPGVFLVDTGYLRPGLAACYVLRGRDSAAVVETGHVHAVPRVLAALQQLGIAREAVSHVIVTHVHLDHAGGAGALMRALPQGHAGGPPARRPPPDRPGQALGRHRRRLRRGGHPGPLRRAHPGPGRAGGGGAGRLLARPGRAPAALPRRPRPRQAPLRGLRRGHPRLLHRRLLRPQLPARPTAARTAPSSASPPRRCSSTRRRSTPRSTGCWRRSRSGST